MSIEVMTWVWKTQLKPTLKLTLLALADYSNDKGVCWPSIDSMVKKSSLTRSSLIKNVQKLCNIGVIEKQKRYENGKRSSNEYRIKIELSPESIRMDSVRTKSIRTKSIRMENHRASPENGPTTIYKPSRTINICAPAHKCAKSANNYSDAFLKFYADYPRKRDRKRAWKAWQKNNQKEKKTDKIMEGIINYKREIKLKNTEEEFIKYPTTWLNGECWEDEYEIAKPKHNPWVKCKECGKEMGKRSDSDYCYTCEDKRRPPASKEVTKNALKQLKNILPKVVAHA